MLLRDASRVAASDRIELRIDGRALSFSDLDRVLWPPLGLTKGWLVGYYALVAPVLLPHIHIRATR